MTRLVVATRKSALALTQTRAFVQVLRGHHPELVVEELGVTTTGDRVYEQPLTELGGKGLFIKEVEDAVLEGRADLAVHSLKDVPGELAPGLILGCIPRRADARDVLVTRTGATLAELPPGARVGTGSLRRQIQLGWLRPDLVFVSLRGNVDTRLRRCQEGVVDAVVLARAGLERMGLGERVIETFDPERCIPAAGQGALAIEWRRGDDRLARLLQPLEDRDTALAVAAERGVMLAVGGSCRLPMAAYAARQGGELWLSALLAEPDGSRPRRRELRRAWPSSAAAAEALGRELGLGLLEG
jgi:hydroxymethylbilane synthase